MTSDTLDSIKEALERNPQDIPIYFDQLFKQILENNESLELLKQYQSHANIHSMKEMLGNVIGYTKMLESNSDHENMLEGLGYY